MTVKVIYCDKCENEIKDKPYKYTVSWEDKLFTNTTEITLCRKCAKTFQNEVLRAK